MKRLAVLILFLICTGGCLKPVSHLYPSDPDLRPISVYVISHGWHVGIAVESQAIRGQLPEHENIPQTEWLKFGWGDRRYYTEPDAGFWLAMRAAFLPTRSVIHVVGIDRPVEIYFPGSTIVEIKVTEEGAEEMGKFIANRFRLDDEGKPVITSDGLYSNSYFFEANGRYYLPKTSNNWTARALRNTGFPITPIYAFTSGNIIQQARKDGVILQQ